MPAQSKSNEIFSADSVADSNAGINDKDSNDSNSVNEGDDTFYSDGGDLGEPKNRDSGNSEDGNTGQHRNAIVMAIYAEDSGMDDSSVPDSDIMDTYSVDLLNSD